MLRVADINFYLFYFYQPFQVGLTFGLRITRFISYPLSKEVKAYPQ